MLKVNWEEGEMRNNLHSHNNFSGNWGRQAETQNWRYWLGGRLKRHEN